MILGSHNSWTFLTPRRWWMRLIAWTARCQSATIREQYEAGARCFDLRIKFSDGELMIAHGLVEYKYTEANLDYDLEFLNSRGDCMVRVLHEIRTDSEKNKEELKLFKYGCRRLLRNFPKIHFFGGQNLIDWTVDFNFGTDEPSVEDAYGSVAKPKTIFELWPWLYAKLYNELNMEKGTEREVLLIDFIK